MSKLPARTGWQWLKQGFGLLRKQPGMLTMLVFANVLLSISLSQLPLLGPLVATLLVPSLSISVFKACHLIEQNQRILPGVFLTGFRQPAFAALCRLGMVYLGFTMLIVAILALSISTEFWKKLAVPIDPKTGPVLNAGDMRTLLLIVLTQCTLLILMCFSAPLTYWQKMRPGKATFYSVFGVIGARGPMLVLLLSWFGIFSGICMLVALVLGNGNGLRAVLMWVTTIFMVLLQCALYASYRQIFGDPDAKTEPA